jgi:hypothetical protein
MSLLKELSFSGQDRCRMSVNKCFEKRLLRKGRPDKLKSMKALDMSARALISVPKRNN